MADAAERKEGAAAELQPTSNGHHAPHEQQHLADPEQILRHLLQMIYAHDNKESAVAAALKAVMSLQQEEGPESGEDEEIGNGIEGSLSCPTAGSVGQPGLSCLARSASDGSTTASTLPNGNSEGLTQGQEEGGLLGSAGGSNERLAQGANTGNSELAPREDLASALNSFPGCKRLVDAYRRIFRIPNKTPLSVLYEYASRLNLELTFEEYQDSMGPFTMESKLKDVDGTVLYRPGIGKARAKKDAKQLAAASLLEILLESVPFQDLLYKSVKQQQLRDLQALRPRGLAPAKGRLGYRVAGRPPHPVQPAPVVGRHLGKPPSALLPPHLLRALPPGALGGPACSQAFGAPSNAATAAALQGLLPGAGQPQAYLSYLRSMQQGGLPDQATVGLGGLSGADAGSNGFLNGGGLDFIARSMDLGGSFPAAASCAGQGTPFGGFPTLDITGQHQGGLGGLHGGGLLGGRDVFGNEQQGSASPIAGLESGLGGLSFDNMTTLLDMQSAGSQGLNDGVFSNVAMNALGSTAGFARRTPSWNGQCDALA